MALLGNLPHKPLNSQYILTVAARFFTTQSPNFNTFPDIPTSAYYDDEVNAAGRSRDFDGLCHLLNKRVKDHCCNTTNTFKFITSTDASLSLLDDLCRTLARLDNGFARKSAYDSLIARLCKLQRVDEALRVVEMMARGNYGLNACSFHPLLNVVTRKKRMEEAWGVVDLMRRLGAPPDLTAYNYLLMAYCFSGELDPTAAVLKRIEEEGMRADTRTYDALVLGACKAGKVEGALVLLRRMVDDGVPMQLSTHVYVIDSLLSAGFYDQAVKFVRSFSGRDTWLDKENFGSLANRLIKLKRFDKAKQVLDEMKSRGLDIGDKLKEKYEIIYC
ncbi:pentatricopeptide repeat-containing protein At3g56030-like [Prunus avium]|uniref:Pentatricopeptide repeat-containing protein At3g56030-like n=1 Tax=Prunus avium TaxID=42229 RepID=A0A6P5RV97_PRUAV|nr:pentatricopeptide repeat-containing protein At3g56030-like [Prunus avium]